MLLIIKFCSSESGERYSVELKPFCDHIFKHTFDKPDNFQRIYNTLVIKHV